MIGYKRIDFKTHSKTDFMSGFIIFLIALPLSIGISIASGAPASAGIIAAGLGGVIGSLLGGSSLTINGPAAGMIVVVLGAVNSLAEGDPLLGYKRALACFIVVGALQIICGFLKLGKSVLVCPTSVVHGMMAAIGCIIMIKQFPVLLGVKPSSASIMGILGEIPSMIPRANLPIVFLGLICIMILILWMYLPSRISKVIPGPLVAVSIGLAACYMLGFDIDHRLDVFGSAWNVGPNFLVKLPQNASELIVTPIFDRLFTLQSFIAIVALFLVGSLESQLSTLAVDKLDPAKNGSDFDQEFIGKGAVNLLCGILGGLPIISEIVRSSANIQNGAKSPLSNFMHGVYLLAFVVLFPVLLAHIPLTSLAAILIVVGWRLGNPKNWLAAYHHGMLPFATFMTTLILTLVEDLLVGIFAGILLNIVVLLVKGVAPKYFMGADANVASGNNNKIEVSGALVFSGYLSLLKKILSVKNSIVELDMTKVSILDETARDNLKDLEEDFRRQGKTLKLNWPKA